VVEKIKPHYYPLGTFKRKRKFVLILSHNCLSTTTQVAMYLHTHFKTEIA